MAMALDHLKKKPAAKAEPAAGKKTSKELDAVFGLLLPKDEAGNPVTTFGPHSAQAAAAAAVVPPAPKSVVYRCLHTELIARFKSGDCPPCRAKRRREKAAKERERREKKWADASSQFRFPPGSFFGNVSWDGVTWAGSLSVPQPNGTIRQWHGTGTAVEKVLRALKDAYVASLAESATA
jgi:hypothetical protein